MGSTSFTLFNVFQRISTFFQLSFNFLSTYFNMFWRILTLTFASRTRFCKNMLKESVKYVDIRWYSKPISTKFHLIYRMKIVEIFCIISSYFNIISTLFQLICTQALQCSSEPSRSPCKISRRARVRAGHRRCQFAFRCQFGFQVFNVCLLHRALHRIVATLARDISI